jgi:hypothetical protein
MTWRTRAGALTVSIYLLLAGCGSPTSPAADVPQLADDLTAVDDALIDGRELQARRNLRQLITTAENAQDSGVLDNAEADRILAAATKLLATLPSGPGPSSTTPPPGPVPDQDGDAGATGQDQDQNDEDSTNTSPKHGKGGDKDKDNGTGKTKGGGKSKGKSKGGG